MSFWKDKKVLITGAAGFIGSNLTENLIKSGSKVSGVDNLERGKLSFLTPAFKAEYFNFFQKDLRDWKQARQVFEFTSPEIVIHLASKVGGIGYYTNKPYEVINENIQIDRNILNASLESGVKRYFYASSAHVYPSIFQATTDSPIIKESQATPSNPKLSYGLAKLLAEKQIEYAQKETPDFRAAIARYIGIYGPNQDYNLDTGSVIPVFSNRAINYPETPFQVWGTGKETRMYCFIDDAIEATKRMIEELENKTLVGPYNVGKQERVSIGEIAREIINISEKKITIDFDTTKETKIWGQMCDCSLIEKDLGFEAKTDLKTGLKEVYKDIQRRLTDDRT